MYVVVIFIVLLLFVYHVWEVVSRDKVIIPRNILSWQCILLFHLVCCSMECSGSENVEFYIIPPP